MYYANVGPVKGPVLHRSVPSAIGVLESPDNPRSDHLLAEVKGGGWLIADWSPDSSQLLAIEELSINESYLYLADAKTGAKERLTAKGPEKVAYAQAQFTKDGKQIVATETYTVGKPESLSQLLSDAATHSPNLIYFAGYANDASVLLTDSFIFHTSVYDLRRAAFGMAKPTSSYFSRKSTARADWSTPATNCSALIHRSSPFSESTPTAPRGGSPKFS